jgi:hypothetical protein
VASKENAVKKYIVTLSEEERKQLTTFIHNGKHPAQQLLKARILLKADASPNGEGWSDGRIRDGAGDQCRYGRPEVVYRLRFLGHRIEPYAAMGAV